MKKLTITLTKRQIYLIRDFVYKNGYPEFSGKEFWLIAQPVIGEFREKLDVVLLTKTQGHKLDKFCRKSKLFKD